MPHLFRAFYTVSLLVSATSWGCNMAGCTNPSEFAASMSNSVATDFKAQAASATGGGYSSGSGGGGYTPPPAPVAEKKPMPQAAKGDAKRPPINWAQVASKAGDDGRGVLSRFDRIQTKVSPGAGTSTTANESFLNPVISARGADVIQPASVKAMRGLASTGRTPRTFGEDGPQ